MKLSAEEHIDIPRPPEAVFDFAIDCANVPRFLRKAGPVAGVVEAKLEGGTVRRVTLTDGSVLAEEFLALDRPRHHQYRWQGGLKPPFGWLVRSGTGAWDFSATAGGTTMVWSYVFELRSPLVAPAAALGLLLFRRWMRTSLGNLRELLASR